MAANAAGAINYTEDRGRLGAGVEGDEVIPPKLRQAHRAGARGLRYRLKPAADGLSRFRGFGDDSHEDRRRCGAGGRRLTRRAVR